MAEKQQSTQEQLAAVELELKQKELQLKKVQLERELRLAEKTEQEVAEFDNKKENRTLELRGRARVLADQTNTRRNRQSTCAHRMGGNGLNDMFSSTKPERSVVKFVLTTGEMVVRCTRCRKEWIPPLPADYLKAGVVLKRKDFTSEDAWVKALNANIDRAAYEEANRQYIEACNFDNGGMAVGNFGVQFSWKRDGRDIAREKTHEICVGGKLCAL
jgi:hypothetical protein